MSLDPGLSECVQVFLAIDFELDIEDLVAENVVSAQRGARILNKASRAGVKRLSKRTRNIKGKNQARDMQRKKLQTTKWPDVYVFQCRVVDRKTKTESVYNIDCRSTDLHSVSAQYVPLVLGE